MNDSIDLAKIKDRIAKLLAMAADASSPNEAAIAAGRARSLMDKYQVDAFDVQQKVAEEFAKMAAWEKFTDSVPSFIATMAVAIAQYNDCHARYEGGWIDRKSGRVWGKRIQFLGYKSDAELAVQMFGRLEDAVRRLTKEWFKKTGTPYSARVARQFELGAVSEISSRIKALTKERDTITHTGTGTSLMVIKKVAVEAEFGATKYGKGRSVGPSDAAAAMALGAGRIAGRMIEITPTVGAAAAQARIG